MINVNIEKLVALKKAVDSGEISQKVEIQNTNSVVIENYSEIRRKLDSIKDYIESRIHGITVEVSGGLNKKDKNEPDGMKYDPIILTTYKKDEPRSFSKMKLDGFYLTEPNGAKMAYDTYLDFIVSGNKYVEYGTISLWESVCMDILNNTCLTECGFDVNDNSLCLFKDEKVYTIISNLGDEVEGIVTISLPDEDDPSMVIICKDRNVLLSDDCFYIDITEKVVA
jgi:hypothetical protein